MNNVFTRETVHSDDYVTVFATGSCERNGRRGNRAGIGVWFGENHPLNVSEPMEGCHSIHSAEIRAAARAIEQAKSAGIKKLCINTDSEFLAKSVAQWNKTGCTLEYSGNWARNQDDFKVLHDAMKESGIEIKWYHVPGHSGIEGNQKADSLARSGAQVGVSYAGDASDAHISRNESSSDRLY